MTENALAFFSCWRYPEKSGDVAQLGERHVRNVEVVGSNPIISTTKHKHLAKYPFGSMASEGFFTFHGT